MALPTITLFNLTVGDIELVQLAVTVPGSGNEVVSDFNFTDEILNDEQLQTELGAGNLRIDLSGGGLSSGDTTKTLEQSKSIIKPLHDLDIKHNLAGAVAPIVTDDEDAGYSVGSLWVDEVAGTYYFCSDAAAGAAVWVPNGGTSTIKSGTPGIQYNDLQFYIDPNNPTSFDGSSTATAISDLRENFISAGTVTSVTIDDGNWNYGVAASRIDMGVLPAAVEDIYDGGGAGDAWIRPESDGGSNEGRILDTSGSLLEGWFWYVTGESGGFVKLGFLCNFSITAGTWTTTSAVIPIGQFSHVRVAYDADGVANNPTFYIDEVEYTVGDGITEDSTPDGVRVSDSGNSLFVGNRSNLDRNFNGDIGPVRLWDTTISVEESQSLLSIEGDRYEPGIYGINSYTSGRDGQSVTIHAGDMLANAFSNRAGDLLVRAGDSTNTSSANPNGLLTLRSGDGLTPANASGAGAPYAVTIRAGESLTTNVVAGKNSILIRAGDIPSTVTTGTNNAHGGDLTLQAGGVISNGGNNMRGGNVFILGGQNGQGASASEGFIVVRSGPPHPTDFNAPSGSLTFSTGYDSVAPAVTAGTGAIFINTSENIGTSGFASGNIEIRTGDTNSFNNNTSGKIDIIAGNEASQRPGSGQSPDVTIQAGSVSSSGSSRPAGSISLTAGDQINTSNDANSGGGSIALTAGNSSKFGSTSGGGSVSLTAGDHTLNNAIARGGNMSLTAGDVTSTFAGAIAGSVTITSGSCTGNTGTPGAISLIPGTDTGAGIGDIILSYATWPNADGAATEVLTTDGAGTLSWGAADSTRIAQSGIILEACRFFVDFNNQSSWEPNQATTWVDTIDSFTGTASGTVITAGHLNFQEGTDVVNFGTLTTELVDTFAGGGAASAWIRAESDGGGNFARIIAATSSGPTGGWFFYVRGESGGACKLSFWKYFDDTSGDWETTDLEITLNEFTHVAVVYNSDSASNTPFLYVNGVSVGITEVSTPVGTSISNSGGDLFIGNSSGGTRGFDGDIEMVQIYDESILTSEVVDTYNTTLPRFGFGGLGGLQAAYENGNTIVTSASEGIFSVTGTETITLLSSGANASLSALNVSITALGATAAGDINITGSTASGPTQPGGDIFLNAGDGNTTGTGGVIFGIAGDGGATGTGGAVSWTGGAGGVTNSVGGAASLTGGASTGTANGAVVNVVGGAAGATGVQGGKVNIVGGAGGATSGAGGSAVVSGGSPTDGDGGLVGIVGTDGVGTNRSGGVVTIDAGDSTGSANGAAVSITAGDGSVSSVGGAVNITGGDGRTGGDVVITSGGPIGALEAGDVRIIAAKAGGVAGKITLTTESDDVTTAPVAISTQSGFVDQAAEHRTFASSTAITNGVTNQVIVNLGSIVTNGHNLKVVLDVTATDSITDSNFIAYRFVGSFYRAGGTVTAVTAFEDTNTPVGTANWTSNISFHVAISGSTVRLELDNAGGSGTDNFNLAIGTMSVVQLGGRTA